MDVKYINPFLTSIRDVFDTMLNIPFSIGKPHVKSDGVPLHDISGIIGLSGNVTGTVVISLSKQVALGLSSALAGIEISEVNDECTDAVGEIANMIAGGAKKEFPGDNNSISIPSVVIGKHKVSYPGGLPIICIPCETSLGRMSVDVAIKGKNTANISADAQAAAV